MSAETAIGDALERIAARDGALNCFTAVFRDEALAAARALDRQGGDGPLAGAAFAVKDLFDVAGRTTRAGSKIRADDPPAAQDATAVARLRQAGAVLVGATNMDEFAYGFTTENAHYGDTRNPLDEGRTAGGSSGGSAAAVAAGLVRLGLGSDTNGSARVPAAFCGIYGFKPTYGRISRAGAAPLAWSFDHVGILAGTARDAAMAFDAVQGPDPRDPVCADRPAAPVLPLLDRGVDGLRLAVADGHFSTGGTPGMFEAVERAAAALGADRRAAVPEAARAVAASLLITSAEGAALHIDEIRGRAADFDPHTRDRWIASALIPSVWHQEAQRFRRRFRDLVAGLFERIDLLLTPTTPFPAPRRGQSRIEIEGQEVPVRAALGRYTAPFSFIGLPAISAPVDVGGPLPAGVQLVGAPGRDDLVLRAAAALEASGAAPP